MGDPSHSVTQCDLLKNGLPSDSDMNLIRIDSYTLLHSATVCSRLLRAHRSLSMSSRPTSSEPGLSSEVSSCGCYPCIAHHCVTTCYNPLPNALQNALPNALQCPPFHTLQLELLRVHSSPPVSKENSVCKVITSNASAKALFLG